MFKRILIGEVSGSFDDS